MTNYIKVFNDHFEEFINDVHRLFPQDEDVLTSKNTIISIRKINPKMIVKIWKTYIVEKYKDKIEAGDIQFFITKDYANDLTDTSNSDKIMQVINRLRDPIKNMNAENQLKSMKYIQNLTKLSEFCIV